MPTEREIQILKTCLKYQSNPHALSLVAEELHVSRSAISKTKTLVFNNMLKHLDLVTEYYPLFENKALGSDVGFKVKEKLRKLNREIRESAKKAGIKESR